MPDTTQIPFLINLLDDESPTVREPVLEQLAAFGPTLEDEIAHLSNPLTKQQQHTLRGIFEVHNRHWLSEAWPKWFDIRDDYEKLETAFDLVADFQNGRPYPIKTKQALDHLASDFRTSTGQRDAFQLANFLFKRKKLLPFRLQTY